MKNKLFRELFNSKTLSTILVVMIGVAFYVALQNFEAVTQHINGVLDILAPFVYAFGIAFLLNPLVKKIEKQLSRLIKNKARLCNSLAIIITYVIALTFVVVLVAMVIPHVTLSITTLYSGLPSYLLNLEKLLASIEVQLGLGMDSLPDIFNFELDLAQMVTDAAATVAPYVLDYSVQLGSSLFSIIMAVIVSAYMLVGKKRLLQQCRKLLFAVMPTQKANDTLSVLAHINKVFSGFIIGKALDSLIIGILCFIGMTILQLPFTPLISLIIGVTNFIPFFGPFIGAVPSVLILLLVNPIDALWFGIFVLLLQQFDGNFLGPHILGDSTGLSAIWVLTAIVVGGGVFGVAGMIIGVPVFAVLYHFTSHAINKALAKKGLNPDATPKPPDDEENSPPEPPPTEITSAS